MPGRIVALIVVPVSGVLVMVVIARHIVVIVTIVRDRLHHHLLLPLLIAIAIDGKRWEMIYLQTTLPIWQSRLFTYFLII